MMDVIHPVSGLSRTERRALFWLRAACGQRNGIRPDAAAEAVAALIGHDIFPAADIRPSAAPFASDGEVRLLAWLALLQRSHAAVLGGVPDGLQAPLGRCAQALRNEGVWLPATAVYRIRPADRPAPSSGNPAAASTLSPQSRLGTARDRAIAAARSRHAISTGELEREGVSRQNLSLLCKGGHLQRVRHGWYRIPAPAGDHRTFC